MIGFGRVFVKEIHEYQCFDSVHIRHRPNVLLERKSFNEFLALKISISKILLLDPKNCWSLSAFLKTGTRTGCFWSS